MRINKIHMTLGEELPDEVLETADLRRTSWLQRLIANQPVGETVYAIEDCEFEGLDDKLHIYPCTHSYLNRDRQWRTKVTLFLKKDRLQRILFQVFEGQTAALNFLERFEVAAAKAMGEPQHSDRYSSRWQREGARVEAYLYPDHLNADFVLELDD